MNVYGGHWSSSPFQRPPHSHSILSPRSVHNSPEERRADGHDRCWPPGFEYYWVTVI